MAGSNMTNTSDKTSKVEVRDNVIWIKHIKNNSALAAHLCSMNAGESIKLEVAGERGLWCKMNNQNNDEKRPTNGIKPADEKTKDFWWSMQDYRREGHYVAIQRIG
ncbi:MAG: hypothetical protein ACR2OT_04890 [Parvibaculales bacterium]